MAKHREGNDYSKLNSVRSTLIVPNQLSDFSSSNSNSNETSKMCIKHPKLVKILSNMRQISPQRVARDKEQPVSGNIQEILQLRLHKRVALAPASGDSTPNREFLQLKARIEHGRTSVLLDLCKNSRFRKSRVLATES